MTTLDDLVAEPIWVAWRNEARAEKPDKLTKVPYSPASGAKAESDNPSTWGLRAEAAARAKKIVNGLGGGVGAMLGAERDDGTALGGIDLDTCRSSDGQFEPWAGSVIERFGSYAEVSPSGSGAKVFFCYRSADLPRIREMMGTKTGRQFKWRTGDDHPPAIELYVSHRYFAVTGEGIDPELIELRVVDFGDIEWLMKEAGPAFVADDPNRRGGSNGHDRGGFDNSRSGAALRLGLQMRRAGADFEAFREALKSDPETSDWYAEKGAANGERELNRIWDKAEEAAIAAVTLDDFNAYMPQHNYIFAPTGETWPAASVNTRIPPVPLVDNNGAPRLNNKGEQVCIPAATWLDKNRAVEQMTWWPGEPQIIADRLTSHAGWIERPGAHVFNLYRPAAIALGSAGSAKPWLRHLRRVYPDDHVHIARFLAHRTQRPGEKINHAIVLGGVQGIGKDSLLEPVKQAVGPWNWADITPDELNGTLNDFAKSVVLRINEGRDLGDINRYQFYEHTKSYIAAPPDMRRVNEKHLRQYYAPNLCGVIITTNHKTDGIYLPSDDRRHYVAWSSCEMADFDDGYWNRLWRWYCGGGGFGHVAAYLSEVDISDFDPKAPPPKTDAWWATVDAGRPTEDADFVNVVDKLKNPDAFVIDDLVEAATGTFCDWLRDRKNRRVIPHRLEAVGYAPVRNKDADSDGMWRIDGKRCVAYARSALTVREQIEATLRRQREGLQAVRGKSQ